MKRILPAVLATLLFANPLVSQAPATNATKLYLGAAWYPEAWPESRWERDLTLMQQAGINFVRITEFAWSAMEPSEGHYDLDWVDRAIRQAEKHGIAVVLGTPSAAPPAWLTQKYPETLWVDQNGKRVEHGNRQQFNWANPKYRELSAKMASAMAERFGHDPNVIGWQIDNEYAEVSYDPETKKMFQDWLRARYGTLDNLNARWTTSYWSQTYNEWSQIPIETKYGNPGLLLSWKRFVSDTWRSYQKNQLDVIRAKADHRQWITTNMMGWFDEYDHYTVSQDLDLTSWDDYVGSGHLNAARNGAAHDLTRGFLRKNFWVMETQPGFVNWHANNNALDKGEVRAMAWHDIGHGADAVEYWQWRSALNGQEEYHGTLVGADGEPVPLYDEIAQVGKEFTAASRELMGTTVKSEVAVLQSYESRWAINWQRHNRQWDPVDVLISYYQPLRAEAHSIDVVSPSAPLDSYKLVVAPAMNLLTPQQTANLMQYVERGGHLVFGQRSVMKDEDNSLQTARQPGPFAAPLGGRVEQYYALQAPVPVEGAWGSGTSTMWAEQLSAKSDTETLMRYGKSNGWLDGQPAAITKKVGKGRITYIGAWLDENTAKKAAHWMLDTSGVKSAWPVMPEGVELSLRQGNDREIAILVNLSTETKAITLPGARKDILHNNASVTSVSLPAYGVAVLGNR
ncbi:MAG: beta-galactosidase [Acidobacteriaceae bacterium]|nr:beta-galactosidase [Acidobacteriaceae bacterium]